MEPTAQVQMLSIHTLLNRGGRLNRLSVLNPERIFPWPARQGNSDDHHQQQPPSLDDGPQRANGSPLAGYGVCVGDKASHCYQLWFPVCYQDAVQVASVAILDTRLLPATCRDIGALQSESPFKTPLSAAKIQAHAPQILLSTGSVNTYEIVMFLPNITPKVRPRANLIARNS